MRRLLPALLAVGTVSALAAPVAAAAPAPALSIRSLAVPTYFKPGDEENEYLYELVVANGGGAFTDGGPLTITDELPAGVAVKKVELPLRQPTGVANFSSTFCKTESVGESQTVRCTVPEEIPEAQPALLGPSEAVRLIIQLTVPAGTPEGEIVNHARVQGGGAPAVSVISRNRISDEAVPAGFEEFQSLLSGDDGLPSSAAGSHPYQYTTSFAVNTKAAVPGSQGKFEPAGGDIRNIDVALPPGLVGNPTATSLCAAQQFNSLHEVIVPDAAHTLMETTECPDSSVVGLVLVQQVEGEGGILPLPLYNLVPPRGMPAQFGFQIFGAPFFINTKLRTGDDYGITAYLRNTSEAKRVTAASVTLWGTPAAASHDPLRGECLNAFQTIPFSLGTCPAGLTPKPLMRLPTSCGAALLTEMSFNSWSDPLALNSESSLAPAPGGCAALDFSPLLSAVPKVSVADSPTGLAVNLHLPQAEAPGGLAEADLRDAVVTLPRGVTVNPASAGGLVGCAPAQIELKGPNPAGCPDASKVGSVEVHTPLLDHPVRGGVYVASQNDNPFNSLIAIYIAAHDPQSGVVLKLAGRVVPDPQSGQLTTTFVDNPQLPFEDLSVSFFDGPRAPLRTPTTCGTYTTTTALRPWSAPQSGPDATPSDSFTVTTAPGGGPCAPSEAAQPHRPSFSAGTIAPLAGEASPFVLRLRREDGSQALRGLNLTLPRGLLAKLAGVPYCPEAALAAAAARPGRAEQASPSCPAASQVGTVTVGAGAGPSPLYVAGKAYLTGPYKGAPLSLAIITPAVAGPFDLGTVVVRAALRVDPETAQVSAVSDPIPTILQGIPLDVRSISVSVDRPDFTLNPTSCAEKTVGAQAIALSGQSALLSDRFQVGGCRGLDFAPNLTLRLKGGTKRAGNPALRAELKAKSGQANIARTVVTLPPGEQIDNAHINNPCTRVQFNANQCPKGSILGRARAFTPLLDAPLEGPVYFRSNGGARELPDIVADLNGQIRIILVGFIDATNARVRTTFQTVPDAPVSKFTLRLYGGKKGLLTNNRDICARTYRATVKMTAHNGRVHNFQPRVKASCGKKR